MRTTTNKMATLDHVSSSPTLQQPPISSPMAAPNEFGPQRVDKRLTTPDEEPQGKPGDGGEGTRQQQQQQQQQQQEGQAEQWQASQQPQVEGGQKVEAFNPQEYWEVVSSNMVSEVQDVVKKGQQEWKELCGKEQLCLSRLQQLCKAAHTLNASFHNQRDNLHSTVLTMASSFKK
ncbi:UPF0746 protein DDB_G0281095-like [Portunus trituberculatus]|uniref:UPF0746 protein DDB_G0281095-like n=1 Tax=Portunus trituberculatus TaxID=210409 RepID=UPI001E1CFC1F|nr:UPF0746 protein DDB_G0281095-like [Portunus trituberculatus]